MIPYKIIGVAPASSPAPQSYDIPQLPTDLRTKTAMRTLTKTYGPGIRALAAFVAGALIGSAIVAQVFAAMADSAGDWDKLAYALGSLLMLILGTAIGAATRSPTVVRSRQRPMRAARPAGVAREMPA